MNYSEIIYIDVTSKGVLVAKRSSDKTVRRFDVATSTPLNPSDMFLNWIDSIIKEGHQKVILVSVSGLIGDCFRFIEDFGKTLPECVVFFDHNSIVKKYSLIGWFVVFKF